MNDDKTEKHKFSQTSKQKLHEAHWNQMKIFKKTNQVHNQFLEKCISLQNQCFPQVKLKLQSKKHFTP